MRPIPRHVPSSVQLGALICISLQDFYTLFLRKSPCIIDLLKLSFRHYLVAFFNLHIVPCNRCELTQRNPQRKKNCLERRVGKGNFSVSGCTHLSGSHVGFFLAFEAVWEKMIDCEFNPVWYYSFKAYSGPSRLLWERWILGIQDLLKAEHFPWEISMLHWIFFYSNIIMQWENGELSEQEVIWSFDCHC